MGHPKTSPKKARLFFSEEKKQKTFISFALSTPACHCHG
jgi:hypothetical protein